MFGLRRDLVRAVLAAKLTLGFFLASLLVTVNAFREELSCWAPLLYTIMMGPLSEFSYVGALQRTAAALLYGSLLGTAFAAIVFFVARHLIWLRIICIFLVMAPISLLRLSNQHALLSIFTAVALGLVLNSSLELQAILSSSSSSSSLEVASSARSLMRQFCISASIAYLVGVFTAVVLFPLPASSALRDALERMLNEIGRRVSALASELFGLIDQAESAWRETQASRVSAGKAGDTTACDIDSEWGPSLTPSIRAPLSATERCAVGTEHAFSAEFTIIDDEDYAMLQDEGALFLQERLWELQALVVFAHREWTLPEVTQVVPIADWAQTVLAVREIISRVAGVESLLGRRRGRRGYRQADHDLGLALDQLFKHSLVDVMRLWAIIAASCHQLSRLLADSHPRWYRWIPCRKRHVSPSQHAQAILNRLLETKTVLRLRQGALASGLVGYERYWQHMLSLYQKVGREESPDLRGSCSSRTSALFAEDVSAAWFSAIMMHRIVDAVQDAYRAAQALLPNHQIASANGTHDPEGFCGRVRALLTNVTGEFFALPWEVAHDVKALCTQMRLPGWTECRTALRTHRWQVVFFFKFYLLCAMTLSVVTSIPEQTTLRSEWNIIWLYFSVVITARPTTESAISVGLMRVNGTIVGAVLGYLVMLRPLIATNAYAVSALSILIIYVFFYFALLDRHKWLQYAARVGVLTYTLVVMCQYEGLDYVAQWQYALSRCVTTCAGVLLAVLVVAALSPRMAVRESRQILSRVFSTAAEATGSFHAVYVTRDTSTQLATHITPEFLLEHYSSFSSLTRSPSLVSLLPTTASSDRIGSPREAGNDDVTQATASAPADRRSRSSLMIDRAATLLLQRITTDLLAARSAVLPTFGGTTQFTMWRSGLFSAPPYIWRGIDGLWLLLLRLEVIEGVLERPPIYTSRYTGAAVRLFILPLETEWQALFDALRTLSEAIHSYLSGFSLWHDLGVERILPQGLCRQHRPRSQDVALKANEAERQQSMSRSPALPAELGWERQSHGDASPKRAVTDSAGHLYWLDERVAEALLIFRKRRSRLWWCLTKRRDRVRRVALSRALSQRQRRVVDMMGALFLGQEEAERASMSDAIIEPESQTMNADALNGNTRASENEIATSTSHFDQQRLKDLDEVRSPERFASNADALGCTALSVPSAQPVPITIETPSNEVSGAAFTQERALSSFAAAEPRSETARNGRALPAGSAAGMVTVSPLAENGNESIALFPVDAALVLSGGNAASPPLQRLEQEFVSAPSSDVGVAMKYSESVVAKPSGKLESIRRQRRQRQHRSRHRLPPEEEESIIRELTSLAEYSAGHRLFASSVQKPVHVSHSVGLPIDDFVHFSSYLFALRETLNSFDFAVRMIAGTD
ncbi:hypothetical protein CCYA_CCYA03G0937 [Cyanidiococcus yangmingshanensis]|nr:hypothetical protein CCYA_CCYA03G0937 [Cyanidiococcus yangmingshanensis]